MTIAPDPTINVISPTGSARGPWPTGFTFGALSDVAVKVTTSTGQHDLVQGVGFTLIAPSPQVSGGSITLAESIVPTAGWAATDRVVIYRATPLRQATAFSDTAGHRPRATEQALDHAMRIAQELHAQNQSALRAPLGEPGTELPRAVDRAGHVLAFDAQGRPTLDGPTHGELMATVARYQELASASLLPRLTVDTVAELKLLARGVASSVWLNGRTSAGDGGAGQFVFVDGDLSTLVEGDALGAVFVSPAGEDGSEGAWVRAFDGDLAFEWFGGGRGDVAGDNAAFAAAASFMRSCPYRTLKLRAREHYQTTTHILPAGTTLKLDGKYDWWLSNPSGGVIKTVGPGNPQIWTDIGGDDDVEQTPQFVAGGNSVHFDNITLITDGATPWSIGILFPTVKQCGFRRLFAFGHTTAPVYLDCTWSPDNAALLALHPEVTPDTGMNEFLGEDFYLNGATGSGGAPGIMVQGTRRDPDDFEAEDFIWAPGGGSDIVFQNGRCSGWSIDAAMKNAAKVVQGIRFINVNPRTSTRTLMMRVDRGHRIEIVGGYGEAGTGSVARIEFTSRTGNVLFLGGRYIRANVWLDGVDTGKTLDTYEASNVSMVTFDGIFRGSGVSIQGSAVRPMADNTGSLGTSTLNWAGVRTRSIRADMGGVNIRAVTGIELAPTSSAVRAKVDASGFYSIPNGTDPRLSVTDTITTISNPLALPGGARIVTYSGSPEGVVSAAPGSQCLNLSGGAPYYKSTGTGNTGWVQL